MFKKQCPNCSQHPSTSQTATEKNIVVAQNLFLKLSVRKLIEEFTEEYLKNIRSYTFMSDDTGPEIEAKIRDYLKKATNPKIFSPMDVTREAIAKATGLPDDDLEWGLYKLQGADGVFSTGPQKIEKISCSFTCYLLAKNKNSEKCKRKLYESSLGHHKLRLFTAIIFVMLCAAFMSISITRKINITAALAFLLGGMAFLTSYVLTRIISNKYYFTMQKIKEIKYIKAYIIAFVLSLGCVLFFWNRGVSLNNLWLVIGIISGTASTVGIIVGLFRSKK